MLQAIDWPESNIFRERVLHKNQTHLLKTSQLHYSFQLFTFIKTYTISFKMSTFKLTLWGGVDVFVLVKWQKSEEARPNKLDVQVQTEGR